MCLLTSRESLIQYVMQTIYYNGPEAELHLPAHKQGESDPISDADNIPQWTGG